ncbi:f-box/wd repeat-containing protein [Anaeramoeba flamelloides]|uniref:F-box/wd repeat-containing protein n=1 Tax=Anaeramoeba flamelloides TaxID=1746091 RepID=A0AAV7ZH15_9EUKA|nr:f-box/wd repeat-containing protein [Anaeramoeba flamelloides]
MPKKKYKITYFRKNQKYTKIIKEKINIQEGNELELDQDQDQEQKIKKKHCYHILKQDLVESQDKSLISDFTQILPDELIMEIFSYLSVKNLCKCNLVSRNWNRLSNDDLLWYNQDLRLSKTFSRYLSGWKAIHFVKKNKNHKFVENLAAFDKVNSLNSFQYFSGYKCTSHNHPCILLYKNSFKISGKGIFLQVPLNKTQQALNLYALLLKQRKYHPKFQVGKNLNYNFQLNKQDRSLTVKKISNNFSKKPMCKKFF